MGSFILLHKQSMKTFYQSASGDLIVSWSMKVKTLENMFRYANWRVIITSSQYC